MPSLTSRLQQPLRCARAGLACLLLLGLSACSAIDANTRAAGADAERVGESGAVVVRPSSPTPEARARFAEAVEAMEQVRFDEARAILEALAGQYPHMSGPPTNLGILAAQVENDPDRALDYFRAALAANPANAVAHNWMGVLLRKQGAYAKAEQHYLAAVQARPDYAFAHRNLGVLYDLYLERPAEASRHYQAYRQLAEGSDALMAEVWLRALQTEQIRLPAVAAIDEGGQP